MIGGRQWAGGRNYLFNLLAVLARYETVRLQPVLFVGTDNAEDEIAPFAALPGLEVVRCDELNAARRHPVQALLWGRNVAVASVFARHWIDLVFESALFFGWRLEWPAIAWIPDFQHRQLPALFPFMARLKRELGFRAQIAGGRNIMLSSEDSRRACERLYPVTRGRTRTVPFAILPSPPVSRVKARQIALEYGLSDPFFFLPNQFWRHKNHMLVLEAMALLRQRGRRVVVAASGHQADLRCPEHFPAVLKRIDQLGLRDDFRLLGMIPYPHVAALLQACDALINPSLLEGWSTTVEEARLLGTPMLLSDLDVHQEQMGTAARYFDRYAAASLAECLEAFVPMSEAERSRALEIAQQQGEVRARKYAGDFADFARDCMHHRCFA